MSFISFRDAVTKRIINLLSNPTTVAFKVSVDRHQLWEAYLNAYPKETRQFHNCNTCQNFINRFGHVGVVKDGRFHSVLDVKTLPKYQPSVDAMMKIIEEASIKGVYMSPETSYGTKNNISGPQSSNPGIEWDHLYVNIPTHLVGADAISVMASYKKQFDTLKRACKEITSHAVDLTLQLMSQKLIPRGEQYRGMTEEFQDILTGYKEASNKDIFLWEILSKSTSASDIRNSYIGTFLLDVSSGKDELQCLNSLQAKEEGFMMSKSIATPKQIEAMKKAIQDAGLESSMYRRHSTSTDINPTNTLYVHRSDHVITDMFSDLATNQKVNPKKIAARDMSVDEFLTILPKISDIEMLVESKHDTNFVSVTAPMYADSLPLFPWNNRFAWTYSNDNASSKIKKAVKAAGGDVEGVIRISLAWHNPDDLDLHVWEPNGNHIYHLNSGRMHLSSGMLDIDMNVKSSGPKCSATNPVENVTYQDFNRIPQGEFKVAVKNFTQRTHTNGGYTIEIEYDSEVHTFTFPVSPRNGVTQQVTTFNWSKTNGLTIKGSNSTTQSKTKWGVDTNEFYKVDMIINSPNHWNDNFFGNKHLMFISNKFINDENPRGFFNEQIKPDILKSHKRGFQVLGAKMRVPDSNDQVSGLGFPDTQRNHIILKYRLNGVPKTSKINF